MTALLSCTACGERRATVFLVRENVPAHQNLLQRTEEEALAAVRGDLRLAVCGACGCVFNTAFDYAKLAYEDAYESDQTISPVFREHLDALVRSLAVDPTVRDRAIVEIGSGTGYFLQRLVAAAGGSTRGIGFDPTYRGEESEAGGAVRFVRSPYDALAAGTQADVVICRHVLEHLPDPAGLVALANRALAGSAGGRVFFETPSIDWILRNGVIWDLYYEHYAVFSNRSLTVMLERGGFRVDSIEECFGGQYLWLAGTRGAARAATAPAEATAGETPELARRFAELEREEIARWRAKIESLARDGRVALWGAGAKGVTLANLIDPDRRLIDCLVDANPRKQGTFVSGTAHPIVSPQALAERGVRTAVVMNPNYLAENEAVVREGGMGVRLVL
jgi:SAM-dependent methyltransferase